MAALIVINGTFFRLSSQKKSGNTNSVYLHNEAPVAKEESITNEEDNVSDITWYFT